MCSTLLVAQPCNLNTPRQQGLAEGTLIQVLPLTHTHPLLHSSGFLLCLCLVSKLLAGRERWGAGSKGSLVQRQSSGMSWDHSSGCQQGVL